MPRPVETRVDEHGPLREVDGSSYVVVRRPGCVPFLMTVGEWLKLPEARREPKCVACGHPVDMHMRGSQTGRGDCYVGGCQCTATAEDAEASGDVACDG